MKNCPDCKYSHLEIDEVPCCNCVDYSKFTTTQVPDFEEQKTSTLVYHSQETIQNSNTKMRVFNTGATRDLADRKPDIEGFICPMVLTDYADYMHGKRKQNDGTLRDSDNWQKGIPQCEYVKSLLRHTMHLWLLHRGYPAYDENGKEVTLKDTICGIEFNAMGYHHEELKKNLK